MKTVLAPKTVNGAQCSHGENSQCQHVPIMQGFEVLGVISV